MLNIECGNREFGRRNGSEELGVGKNKGHDIKIVAWGVRHCERSEAIPIPVAANVPYRLLESFDKTKDNTKKPRALRITKKKEISAK
jgi:hypothetical protein